MYHWEDNWRPSQFDSHEFPVVMDKSVSAAAVVIWIYTIVIWYFLEKLSYVSLITMYISVLVGIR